MLYSVTTNNIEIGIAPILEFKYEIQMCIYMLHVLKSLHLQMCMCISIYSIQIYIHIQICMTVAGFRVTEYLSTIWRSKG